MGQRTESKVRLHHEYSLRSLQMARASESTARERESARHVLGSARARRSENESATPAASPDKARPPPPSHGKRRDFALSEGFVEELLSPAPTPYHQIIVVATSLHLF